MGCRVTADIFAAHCGCAAATEGGARMSREYPRLIAVHTHVQAL
jgi:hypothetical protein